MRHRVCARLGAASLLCHEPCRTDVQTPGNRPGGFPQGYAAGGWHAIRTVAKVRFRVPSTGAARHESAEHIRDRWSMRLHAPTTAAEVRFCLVSEPGEYQKGWVQLPFGSSCEGRVTKQLISERGTGVRGIGLPVIIFLGVGEIADGLDHDGRGSG